MTVKVQCSICGEYFEAKKASIAVAFLAVGACLLNIFFGAFGLLLAIHYRDPFLAVLFSTVFIVGIWPFIANAVRDKEVEK